MVLNLILGLMNCQVNLDMTVWERSKAVQLYSHTGSFWFIYENKTF